MCALTLAALLLPGLWPASAAVRFGPMLQGATLTNAYVLAESTTTPVLTVNYGATTNYGSTATTASYTNTAASPVTYVHRIKLTGLQPDTVYHYQMVDGATLYPDYTFRTMVNPGTTFRFAWAADFRDGTAVHGQIANRILNSNNIPRPPLFFITGGDYASDGGYVNWTNQWLVPNERELQKWIPTYMSPGNHEGWGTQMKAYLQPADSTGGNGYYSFDCGDMHIVIGNYQTTYTSGSAQWNWIRQDLTNSLKPWKIFGFHAPAYTYGGSGAHAGDATLQSMTTSLFEPSGVKVVFAGHNHFYQHNLVRDVRHLTVGSAGAPLYAVGSNPTYTIKTAYDNSYLIGDVTPTNLHMVVYNNVGTVLDTIDLVKLPAPTGLAAAAENLSAALTWDPVPGAPSNTIYYGTASGGPYPSKKTSAAANTKVTGLTNAVTYYFVVTAADANGASAISAQISLTAVVVPPQINLTVPADGASFSTPVDIPLSASVITNGNTINKVQFYRDGTTLIGEATAPPYIYTWSNAPAGSYALTARVVYDTSTTLDSAAANITVILSPVVTTFAFDGDNNFSLSGTSKPGRTCILLLATNLMPQATTWVPIFTNIADSYGAFRFTDPDATNATQRFYRVTTP